MCPPTSIGPSFGALILRQSLVALAAFLVAVTLFMSWRLEWKMAGAGLAALAHDLIITVGVYSITWFEVTPATVVALLTILGYSLYDTVVVFDKVTELVTELGDRMNYSDIVNRAMNMVLGRSLNTSLTSLLTGRLGSLCRLLLVRGHGIERLCTRSVCRFGRQHLFLDLRGRAAARHLEGGRRGVDQPAHQARGPGRAAPSRDGCGPQADVLRGALAGRDLPKGAVK